jgi:hypothetical protein
MDLRTKTDLDVMVATISKINDATLEALHFAERDNVPFALGALRLGEQHLRELVEDYKSLLKRLSGSAIAPR